MMPKTNNIPEVRFAGFTDAWEQRKLGEVATYRRGSFPQPYGKSEWYDGDGAMPFVQVADVSDEMNLVEETKQKISILAQPMSVFAEKNSVLVTLQGSIGRVAIMQYGAFVDRTVLIFEKYKAEIDKTFWAYIIKQKFIDEARKAPGGTIKTITKEALSDFDLSIPKYQEQKQIGAYFRNLDNLITLHQRKYERLKNVKKSMLEKMFPKNGSNIPEIRFAGFTDAWEQRKLDTITDVRDGTHDSPQYVETGHPFITSKNVKDGFINYEDIQYVSDKDYEEINKRSKVDKNDILMGMIGTIGNIALVRETPDFAIKNVALIKDIGDVYYRYLYHCLQSNSAAHQLDENLDGGTQKFIALNKIRELVIPVPSEHEQHKIGDYMESLDNLITLHQRKLEKLQNIKKSMLEKMFV